MATIRDAATVTVKKPVDGTKKRRRHTWPADRCGAVTSVKVDPRVLATAKKILREGERLCLVSEFEVWTINR